MYCNLKKRNLPLILLNGRITKKSFSRWKILTKFSNKIFSIFDLCLSANKESKKYLKELGAKNVKLIGNLKFSQSENEKISINTNLKKLILSRNTWCASSTHNNEEKFCGLVHKKLKNNYKNLLTIIIPRHINRVNVIIKQMDKLGLTTHTYQSDKKLNKDIDILIVDTYGKTKSFYYYCKNIFLGGSIVNHGGQNPLEAARYGCNIFHGPNIYNFKEIYGFLKKNRISKKISSEKKMINSLAKLFSKKSKSKKIKKKLSLIGQKILNSTYKEISYTLYHEIKKT